MQRQIYALSQGMRINWGKGKLRKFRHCWRGMAVHNLRVSYAPDKPDTCSVLEIEAAYGIENNIIFRYLVVMKWKHIIYKNYYKL